ncbi:endo-1,4-beta-xylanase [Rubripirellula amarantea]|nr:endo-1,4-beta-xylanase [Rubripirellula amarantea]
MNRSLLDAFSTTCIACVLIACVVIAGVSTATAQSDYVGRGSDADWRVAAQKRIDRHRKADLKITVQREYGTKVRNAKVTAKLQRHAFNFGTAVDPRFFLPTEKSYDARYEQTLKRAFHAAVFENHMKWRAWAGGFGPHFSQTVTLNGLDWLNNNEFDVRGHAMIWPRYNSVPDDVRALLDIPHPTDSERQQLYDATFAQINDIGSATKGKVSAWDVINEPRTSFDIEDMLIGFTAPGQPAIASRTDLRKRWLNAAQTAAPDAMLVINDYAILPGGDNPTKPRMDNFTILKELVSAGAPVHAIGFQSHFKDLEFRPNGSRDVTGIPHVINLLDSYQREFGLPIQITEFDIQSDDADLKADYTRDFLMATFSHPSVDSFTFWGFWVGKMSSPEGALFDNDFNITPNGQAYLDLVQHEWRTEAVGGTNSDGIFVTRGFKGEYLVTVEHGGQTQQVTGSLGDGELELVVTMAATAASQK